MTFTVQTYTKLKDSILELLKNKSLVMSNKNNLDFIAYIYCKKILNTTDTWYLKQTKRFLKSSTRENLVDGLTSLVFRLSNDIAFTKWNTYKPLNKVPVKITSVEKTLTNNISFTLDVTIINSTVEKIYTKLVLTGNYCNFLLYKGGSLRAEEYIPQDLTGMYFLCSVKANKGMYLSVYNWETYPNMFNANRKLLKLRKQECIGGFKNGVCVDCPLSTKECKLSRHTKVYKKGSCRLGGHNGYIVKDGLCKYCLDNHKYINNLKKAN